MEMNADVREEPDVSRNVRRTNLSCKFKLRWMGIEIEAEPMRVVLRSGMHLAGRSVRHGLARIHSSST
jgi:hypothetical protein